MSAEKAIETTELKPCPHCGDLAWMHAYGAIFARSGGDIGYRVECEGACHSMTCYWHTEHEAIDAWNRRALPPDVKDGEPVAHEELFEQIDKWAEAYPTDLFPEVHKDDWPRIDKTLTDAGWSLSRISASNMRHVVTRIKEAADASRATPVSNATEEGAKYEQPIAWTLDHDKVNEFQLASIEKVVKRAKQAHYTNLKIRINGQWEEYEADWVKHLYKTSSAQAAEDSEAIKQRRAKVELLVNDMLYVYQIKFDDLNSREAALEAWAGQFLKLLAVTPSIPHYVGASHPLPVDNNAGGELATPKTDAAWRKATELHTETSGNYSRAEAMYEHACQQEAELERLRKALEKVRLKTIVECSQKCEKRADSLREGSAIARQCAKDILSLIQPAVKAEEGEDA